MKVAGCRGPFSKAYTIRRPTNTKTGSKRHMAQARSSLSLYIHCTQTVPCSLQVELDGMNYYDHDPLRRSTFELYWGWVDRKGPLLNIRAHFQLCDSSAILLLSRGKQQVVISVHLVEL